MGLFSEYASAPQRTGTIKGVNVVSPAFLALQDGGKETLLLMLEQQEQII